MTIYEQLLSGIHHLDLRVADREQQLFEEVNKLVAKFSTEILMSITQKCRSLSFGQWP